MRSISPQKKLLNKGFSLVETLVAITILLVAVTGPLTIAQKSLFAANTAKNQTTATFLAQDAVEYLKNIRDENLLNDRNWIDGFSTCTVACSVDTINKVVAICVGGNCEDLRMSTSGVYGHDSGWTLTPFNRKFTIEVINANETKITVTLSWAQGVSSRSFEVVNTIFKWNK